MTRASAAAAMPTALRAPTASAMDAVPIAPRLGIPMTVIVYTLIALPRSLPGAFVWIRVAILVPKSELSTPTTRSNPTAGQYKGE